jgi:FkbM family methyltransferase
VRSFLRKLRPAKVRSAVRRRWFEWRLRDLPLEPGPTLVDLGTVPGGWTIPDGAVSRGQICYCIGAGGDIGFDLELIRRYGAVVRAADPVPEYETEALREAGGEPRFSFRRAALSTRDGTLKMQPHHDDSLAMSASGLYDTTEWFDVEALTLASLMREFGDDHIDLLKVDLEGLEYELVPTLDLVALGVHVFSFQVHHVGSVRDAKRLIEGVERQGFKLVAERPVVKLTFIRAPAAGQPAAGSAILGSRLRWRRRASR